MDAWPALRWALRTHQLSTALPPRYRAGFIIIAIIIHFGHLEILGQSERTVSRKSSSKWQKSDLGFLLSASCRVREPRCIPLEAWKVRQAPRPSLWVSHQAPGQRRCRGEKWVAHRPSVLWGSEQAAVRSESSDLHLALAWWTLHLAGWPTFDRLWNYSESAALHLSGPVS